MRRVWGSKLNHGGICAGGPVGEVTVLRAWRPPGKSKVTARRTIE